MSQLGRKYQLSLHLEEPSGEVFIQKARHFYKRMFDHNPEVAPLFNPANQFANFSFYINSASEVDFRIVDVKGKTIRKILHEQKQEGRHTVHVNLADLPQGIYLYEIRAGFFTDTKKLVIRR